MAQREWSTGAASEACIYVGNQENYEDDEMTMEVKASGRG